MCASSDGADVICELTEESIAIDFNYPLADHTLNFKIEVISANPATQEVKRANLIG
ncbi:MAG: hypothetical protein ACFC03_03155 [Candidatus Malihini olakiniferum]